jgi:formylglycine-generating enzyme required for sulfatase activity
MNNDNSIWVFRGGCWFNGPRLARVDKRAGYDPSGRGGSLGFRLSRLVNPLEQISEMNNGNSSHT